MSRLLISVLFVSLMALGACASNKPCPAYAKAVPTKEIRG